MSVNPALTLGSFLVAIMVGLTGMGGGALLTPMLMLVFGVPPLAAVSSDLVVSAITKPVGALVHLRRGTVNLSLAGWLSIGSVPSAFLGGPPGRPPAPRRPVPPVPPRAPPLAPPPAPPPLRLPPPPAPPAPAAHRRDSRRHHRLDGCLAGSRDRAPASPRRGHPGLGAQPARSQPSHTGGGPGLRGSRWGGLCDHGAQPAGVPAGQQRADGSCSAPAGGTAPASGRPPPGAQAGGRAPPGTGAPAGGRNGMTARGDVIAPRARKHGASPRPLLSRPRRSACVSNGTGSPMPRTWRHAGAKARCS